MPALSRRTPFGSHHLRPSLIALLMVAALLLGGCMFVEEKLKATPVVDHYFQALQQRDVPAALALVRIGDGGPSESVVRESIDKTLAQLGTPVTWNETNFRSFVGTGGNSAELQYTVTYSDAPSAPVQETFQLRSANGSPYTIYRHGMLANPLK